jgi:hypothetical protein
MQFAVHAAGERSRIVVLYRRREKMEVQILDIIYNCNPASIRLRPYSVKRTVSRPNCAVKPLQASSVLRWGTTWESGVP